MFVNLEDKDAVVKIDAKKMTVLERWPLAPGEGPSAMAMDAKTNRLFVGCHNKMMVVVNAETGKVVANQPIGERVDAAAFDPETGLVFFSCGDGTVTVIHEDGPDKYSVAETVKTKPRVEDDGPGPQDARPVPAVGGLQAGAGPDGRQPAVAAGDGPGDFRGPRASESDRPWSPSGPEA